MSFSAVFIRFTLAKVLKAQYLDVQYIYLLCAITVGLIEI